MENEKDIKVSVICIVYNQEEYVRDCLEGAVNQITDFDYEVIVHDDCSTDKTLEIVKEYQSNYPDLIKVIEEKENQFSQCDQRLPNELTEKYIQGEYIACCEGDDYWIDVHKLQKQYDYMREHSECVMCTHNTKKYSLEKLEEVGLFFDWDTTHTLSSEETIVDWLVHCSSFFMKRSVYAWDRILPSIWCGDYALLVYAFSLGEVVALSDIMSVYRCDNPKGALKNTLSKPGDINRGLTSERTRIQFLLEYDELTEKRYERVVNQKIGELNETVGELILQYMYKHGYESFAIYGCGNVGRQIADSLAPGNIKAFIERDNEGEYANIPVKKLSFITKKEFENWDAMIITPTNVIKSIEKNLRDCGYAGKMINVEKMLIEIHDEL